MDTSPSDGCFDWLYEDSFNYCEERTAGMSFNEIQDCCYQMGGGPQACCDAMNNMMGGGGMGGMGMGGGMMGGMMPPRRELLDSRAYSKDENTG